MDLNILKFLGRDNRLCTFDVLGISFPKVLENYTTLAVAPLASRGSNTKGYGIAEK